MNKLKKLLESTLAKDFKIIKEETYILNEQTVYAGSGVQYDTPSLDAFGSNTGDAVHGYGLYFAKNPKVAKKYRNNSNGTQWLYNGDPFLENIDEYTNNELYWDDFNREEKSKLINAKTSRELVSILIKDLNKTINDWEENDIDTNGLKKFKNMLQNIDLNKLVKKDEGMEITVDVPDDEYLMSEASFDSQSPYVKQCLKNMIQSEGMNIKDLKHYRHYPLSYANEGQIYQYVMSFLSGKDRYELYGKESSKYQKLASELLYKYGIKGIRYTGSNDGRCVVIFNPKDIKVINRKGKGINESNYQSSLFDILLESNILTEGIKEVKKYFPKVPEEKIQTLIELDPTYQGGEQLGKYGKWILGLYNKGQLKDEDFYKVTEYLTTFVNNLSKMPNKDIMSYKSLPDLAKAIQGFEGQKDISKKQQVRDIKKGAKKVMETNDWLVIQPTTEESACYYGANTKWCTASKENSMFNYYNEQGPIYIFINKKDNSKFQFHAQSFQFMDVLDKPIAPKEVFDDEKIINFIEDKILDYVYSDNFYLWEDSLLMGLDSDGESNLFIQTNINDFFDSLYSEDTDINRQTINIIENYYRGEITDTQKYYDDEDLTFNSTIKTLFGLYYAGRKLNLQHINTMKYYGFDYIGNEELVKYAKELKSNPLEDNDVRIYDLFGEIESEIIHQINQHLNFFKVTDIEYIDSENDIRMYVETIYDSDNTLDANVDWFMNMNEPLYRDDIFEEIAHKVETPRTNNDILTEMLIHGIIKILNEDSETKSFNVEKNPKEDVVETYLKSSSLRFAFNPMNNDFLICDDLHNPIPLNESADKYITGILSPNLVEITSYVTDDYNDSKEIVENLLGKRFKKIFKNHYQIIL